MTSNPLTSHRIISYLARPGCAFHRKELCLIRCNIVFPGLFHNISREMGEIQLLEGCITNLTLNPAISSTILLVRLSIIHSVFHIQYSIFIIHNITIPNVR